MPTTQLNGLNAQAAELVSHLMTNTIPQWMNARLELFGHDLQSLWCDNNAENKRKLIKRLKAFSRTIKNLRPTKLTEKTTWLSELYRTPLSKEEDRQLPVVIVELGNDAGKNQVILEIAFMVEDTCLSEAEFLLLRPIWGKWTLFSTCTIVCRKHPNSKFKDYVVLGHTPE